MAKTRGEGTGVWTGTGEDRGAEEGVAKDSAFCAGSFRSVGRSGNGPRYPEKELPGVEVSVQPSPRKMRRARPKMARGPGCCRSPINILRCDLPIARSTGVDASPRASLRAPEQAGTSSSPFLMFHSPFVKIFPSFFDTVPQHVPIPLGQSIERAVVDQIRRSSSSKLCCFANHSISLAIH